MSEEPKLGATGRFPDGKVSPDDEGELRAALLIKGSRIELDFGKSLSWLSMTPEDARQFARCLLKMADQIEGNK